MRAVPEDAEQRPLVWAEHREILRRSSPRVPSARPEATPTAPATKPRAGLPSRPCQWEETAMRLTAQQLRQFAEEGYLFLPGCFAEEEVAALRDEAEQIYATDRQEVWREKTGAPRTAFAAHTYNEAFRLLGYHPRLIRPVEQVFGEQLYMHQFKINAKAAFEGDVWQWHQDYGTWARDDGMPEPRAMNIAVFMDEVMPINGPLMLVPRSHKHGVLAAGHDEATTSYPLWTLDQETVTCLVDEGGIVAPTGKPGCVLMFHGNLVHASAPNITPYPRRIVYLTLCAVSNYIRKPTRPEWIAHRDFKPIEPVADDALLKYARGHHPLPDLPPLAGEGKVGVAAE
jgi:L-proline 4-hydroxylase